MPTLGCHVSEPASGCAEAEIAIVAAKTNAKNLFIIFLIFFVPNSIIDSRTLFNFEYKSNYFYSNPKLFKQKKMPITSIIYQNTSTVPPM